VPTSILWYRRDLRLTDHPALAAAIASERVVPVFCFDPRLTGGRHASGPRAQFLLESLQDLAQSLGYRGSRLVIRSGRPETELVALADDVGADAVHASADVGPLARRRDERVRDALGGIEVDLRLHPGQFTADDPSAIVTGSGDAYRVFSPYHRAWSRTARRTPLPAPRCLPGLPATVRLGRLPTLNDLGLRQEVSDPAPGGETSGRERMTAFLRTHVREYATNHDQLAEAGTSALSPYLHFGCISARELESRLPHGAGAAEYRRQLCWRDFYAQLIRAFPGNAQHEYQERVRGKIRWIDDEAAFDAWCAGQTGYPVVDAAMRQLRCEGWMHNRGRLIVGSFLTKHLGIDWRRGERWFMRMLIDGDEANNNGNWQWIASVGVDPQPVARRIYNPSRQQAQHDPDGRYVRRHVPELADVPDRYLAEPWTMPDEVQREAGCVIGRDYPDPIVDHAQARREALARYGSARD
jgi:deoxyribodipyrimidine photo-lyase